MLGHVDNLRELAYRKGSPRQLFFADSISAVVKKKIVHGADEYFRTPLRNEQEIEKVVKDYAEYLWRYLYFVSEMPYRTPYRI